MFFGAWSFHPGERDCCFSTKRRGGFLWLKCLEVSIPASGIVVFPPEYHEYRRYLGRTTVSIPASGIVVFPRLASRRTPLRVWVSIPASGIVVFPLPYLVVAPGGNGSGTPWTAKMTRLEGGLGSKCPLYGLSAPRLVLVYTIFSIATSSNRLKNGSLVAFWVIFSHFRPPKWAANP